MRFSRILLLYPICLCLILAPFRSLYADGPSDNQPDKVRRIPPPGIKIPDQDRTELLTGAENLERGINEARQALQNRPGLLELLPDVQIYHKAVHWAVTYNEVYKTNEISQARRLLQRGQERLEELRQGKPSWTTATGLVVRGYVSKIDGSVQPYGLVVPSSYRADSPVPYRLDLWFHGRGENLTELAFIQGRETSVGEFTPRNGFVLHSYGRFCNGNKFAGETDAFEALAHAQGHYPIDEKRLIVRGFSLGGAACWHMAVHHAWRWAAAAPGAGFSETPEFLKVFQSEKLKPSWYEQKLWHLYDCPDWAMNLFHCPTVAYSGEIDKQKQAADAMAAGMSKEGLELVHIIGPKTAHSYHPQAKIEINRRIDALAERGVQTVPSRVRFVTWTLKYNRMHWIIVDGLEQHWTKAFVDADIGTSDNSVRITTRNVSALTLSFAPGDCPLDQARPTRVFIDGHKPSTPRVQSDRSWVARFQKVGTRWEVGDDGQRDETKLLKRHDLQGPIDDAFMDSFLVVRPTDKPSHAEIGKWVDSEMRRALEQWRQHFRGDARVKNDTEVTEADIAAHHLVLWGDPTSNKLLNRLHEKLPIQWDSQQVRLGKDNFPAAHHVPILIFPNPLNPQKYVVLNSGFTFREYDYLNNARQVPKLPDYAIIDTRVAADSRFPGQVTAAGFFDERWQLTARPGKP
jgi:predicted peptidase